LPLCLQNVFGDCEAYMTEETIDKLRDDDSPTFTQEYKKEPKFDWGDENENN